MVRIDDNAPRPTGVALVDRAVGGVCRGLPLVLFGPMGCGRTVLCIELAAAALSRGETVVYVTDEPPHALLPQAESLGLDLRPGIRSGALVLLELLPDVSRRFRASGAAAFTEAIRGESATADWLIVDTVDALTAEILDEAPLVTAVTELFATYDAVGARVVASARQGPGGTDPLLDRVLSDRCGSLLRLRRGDDGSHWVCVAKSRHGPATPERRFEIGPGGTRLAAEVPPADREEPSPATPTGVEERPSSAGGRPRVLIADSNAEDRDQHARWLAETCDVILAADSFETLSRIVSDAPDLILIDPLLPDRTGFHVLESLQQSALGIPVLAVSARLARIADRVRVLVLGASDVLAKPVSRLELERKVQALLERGRGRRAKPQTDLRDLLYLESKHRSVTRKEFRQRVERASRFGEHFGVESTLVAFVTEDAEALEGLASCCEMQLRSEDALVRISDTQALLLLTAADAKQATRVVERIVGRWIEKCEGDAPVLGSRVAEIDGNALRGRWAPLFEGLVLESAQVRP